MRQMTTGTAVLVAGLALAAPLSAQTDHPASLEGQVVDSATGQALAGVLVRMDTGDQAVSDQDGAFLLEGLAPGPHLLAVLTPECHVTWADVALEPGTAHETLVRVRAPAEAARAAETARRRRHSQGRLVTADEIRRLDEATLAEVIRRVAPNMVGAPAGQLGRATPVQGRTRNSFRESATEPVVVVDGVRVEDPATALDLLRPEAVEVIEILPGAVGGWEFGSEGAAGVIRVSTKRGGGQTAPPDREGCSVPPFPSG